MPVTKWSMWIDVDAMMENGGLTMAETIFQCKHLSGDGWCAINDGYCVEGPCGNADTIEYAPVRHGRWEIRERTFWVKGRDGFIREETRLTHTCGECNVGVVGLEGMNYCPNCGAKMDGGETDEA